MLRDDHIAEIKKRLDNMIQDDSCKLKCDAIIMMANNTMNLEIKQNISDDGIISHEILWFNRKANGSFDECLEKLLKLIRSIDNT